jgi:hypothetical protein
MNIRQKIGLTANPERNLAGPLTQRGKFNECFV